jgi:hypothetical protein
MANWTPTGFVGKMFAANARHVPPPAGLPAPTLWGDAAVVRQRLGANIKSLSSVPQFSEFRYPFPPSEVLSLFRQYFGPTQIAFSKLEPPGQAALAADLLELWEKDNEAGDGTTLVHAEYLEVQAVR